MSLHFGRTVAVAAFAFVVCATSARADNGPVTEGPKVSTPTVAERLQPSASSILATPSPVSVAVEEKPAPAETTMRPPSRSSALPLIAAGLVLLISGAIVDGDAGTILMVGGAGITAYGVYLYVN